MKKGSGLSSEEQVADILTLASAVGLFVCLERTCCRLFKTAPALGRHYQASGHDSVFEPLPDRDVYTRTRYTFRRKREVCLDIMQWIQRCMGDEVQARRQVAKRTGINFDLLGKWMREKDKIFLHANTRKMGGAYAYKESKGKWHDCELQLYMKFISRRRYQGLRVTRKWLRRNFKRTRAEAGHDVAGYYPSGGWCSRFCKRWEIMSQCRTNKKQFSIEERLPKIQGFHQYWILTVQNSSPVRCEKYGRYPPTHMYTMDQVPMPFSSPSKRSLNEKGAPRGNRFTDASEDTKRFCTIQVTLCADPLACSLPRVPRGNNDQ